LASFLDAAAPALLVAQSIGRFGNYFNQELLGGPTTLPWGLEIDPAHRPVGYEGLYVAGYSGFRVFEELLRVDPAHHLFGLRLNLYA
jgi:prolipoprotein diacylglyceryltransferase